MKQRSVSALGNDKSKKQIRIYFLSILIFTFVLYGNSIRNGYAFDDNYVTVTTPERPNNPRVEKGFKGIPEIFTSHYIQSKEQNFEYRPLVLTTFAIEYQFFGSSPHMSHLINVLLYALSGILLFIVLRRLLKDYSIAFPLLITFLFVAHPIHTEVVDNLKSRDELLSFLFGLGTFHFYLKNYETKLTRYFLLAILFLLLSFLCKRTAVLFVALIPLSIYFFTEMSLKKLFVSTLAGFAIFFLYDIVIGILLSDMPVTREFAFFENPLFYEHSYLKRFPLALYTFGYYARLLLVPYPLACYYGYDAIPFVDWGTPLVLISAIFHLGIGLYALRGLKKKNIFSFSICIYFIGIFPFSNLLEPIVGMIGERFVYFASLGFCFALAHFLFVIFKVDVRNKVNGLKIIAPSLKKVLIVLFCIFSVLTIARNTKWKDMLTLCRNDVRHEQESYMLNYFTGLTLFDQLKAIPVGDSRDRIMREAKAHFQKAALILEKGLHAYPNDYYTLSSVGTIYINYLDDVNAGEPWFKRSLAIKPGYEVARYNLIFCYEKRNKPDSAVILYEKMVSEGTRYLPVYLRLHELYLLKKEYEKAIIFDKKILFQNPDEIKLYVNLANTYMLNHDTLNGLRYFEEALNHAPNDYRLLRHIAGIYDIKGNKMKASEFEERAKKLNKQMEK